MPEALRGTYLGLASEPAIQHLVSLGVTAVELMPVHHHVDDWHLVEHGLTNYWGYNTLAYFAPDARYATSASPLECVREFKMMVRALHAAGLEVILDVVYNHTAEGNHLGPTLSLRGIDNATYYRLQPHAPRYYQDFTGCGNTLNMRSPRVLQLIMDSLRYWVHGDARRRLPLRSRERAGSRAARRGQARRVLRHHPPGSDPLAGEADRRAVGSRRRRLPGRQLSDQVDRVERQVPRRGAALLARRRRRAVGARDAARRAAAISTSRAAAGRTPASTSSPRTTASRSPISSATTTSTTRPTAKHNADGENHNLSWNCGVEGPTDDRRVLELRARQRRNFMATLLLLGRRADDQRRRRAGPHAGRQQQRLLPGQRDQLDRLDADAGAAATSWTSRAG